MEQHTQAASARAVTQPTLQEGGGGVRGPPVVLWYWGEQQAPALESCVLRLDARPKELLCSCFAIVLGQVATKVCWQDVSIDLLVEGFQLLAVHKDLGGDGSDPQQRNRAALPSCSVSPKEVPLPAGPSHTHPLQQFALQEGFDHVVGGGEVPRLVDEVDGLEPRWEGVLGSQTQTQMVTDGDLTLAQILPRSEQAAMDTPALAQLSLVHVPFSVLIQRINHPHLRSTRELKSLPDSSLLPPHEDLPWEELNVSGIWSKDRNPALPVSPSSLHQAGLRGS